MDNIPKIIHYCWFWKKKLDQNSINLINWRKNKLPDYEIRKRNEKNFPIKKYKFSQQAYENWKYAFVSDVARLHALYYDWGIYLDTDVEVLKSFDDLLNLNWFIGFEESYVWTAIIGSKSKQEWIRELLNYYRNRNFLTKNRKYFFIPNSYIYTIILTKKFWLKLKKSNQVLDWNINVFEKDIFSPKSYLNWKISSTNNSYTIHHHNWSRMTWKTDNIKKIYKFFNKIWLYETLLINLLRFKVWFWTSFFDFFVLSKIKK